MPPITVTDYEADGNGGWYVAWHDEANLDGQPLDAFIHLTQDKLEELAEARRCVGADCVCYEKAKEQLPLLGESGFPPAVSEWLDGYNEHVRDCCDRHDLGVKDHAPQEVLEAARDGKPVPDEWSVRDETDFEAFIATKTSNRDEE